MTTDPNDGGNAAQERPAFKEHHELDEEFLFAIYRAARCGKSLIESEGDDSRKLSKLKLIFTAIEQELTIGTGQEQPDAGVGNIPCYQCPRFYRLGSPAWCDCVNNCY